MIIILMLNLLKYHVLNLLFLSCHLLFMNLLFLLGHLLELIHLLELLIQLELLILFLLTHSLENLYLLANLLILLLPGIMQYEEHTMKINSIYDLFTYLFINYFILYHISYIYYIKSYIN